MKGIKLPQDASRRLPFYLALEEWVAGHLPDGDYFFAWQVRPSVICGRHQIMSAEINLDFCREAGIDVWRRKSGGGSVYSDSNNVMFSYVTRRDGVQTSFDRYTRSVIKMLGSLGIVAEKSGRNDIEIDGSKVAGNAFYALPGHSIVHGTMLYDADPATMAKVLTPSRAKLMGKGVRSVPARICTLKSKGLHISCREFIDYAVTYLCSDGFYTMTEKDISEVREIELTYLRPEFYNDRVPHTHEGMRIEGVGEFYCKVYLNDCNEIQSLDLKGDFFADGDINTDLCDRLIGTKADRTSLEAALKNIDTTSVIDGLTTEQLIDLILHNHENYLPT